MAQYKIHMVAQRQIQTFADGGANCNLSDNAVLPQTHCIVVNLNMLGHTELQYMCKGKG